MYFFVLINGIIDHIKDAIIKIDVLLAPRYKLSNNNAAKINTIINIRWGLLYYLI